MATKHRDLARPGRIRVGANYDFGFDIHPSDAVVAFMRGADLDGSRFEGAIGYAIPFQ